MGKKPAPGGVIGAVKKNYERKNRGTGRIKLSTQKGKKCKKTHNKQHGYTRRLKGYAGAEHKSNAAGKEGKGGEIELMTTGGRFPTKTNKNNRKEGGGEKKKGETSMVLC